jgi:hypothetical protein
MNPNYLLLQKILKIPKYLNFLEVQVIPLLHLYPMFR